MKITTKNGVIAAVTLCALLVLAAPPAEARVDVSFDLFYSNLSPHGSWMVSNQYGRVWQPAVYQRNWNPYYDGHWEYTDVGWAWVSDYEWGSIPYHYGTWVMDPMIGWVWVPGYTWAPAWVTFRTGPDYIGWAPVSPSFTVGVSIGAPSFDAFLFVPTRDFCAPRLRSYFVPERQARVIVNNTTIINNLTIQNNIVVNRGPDIRVVERASRRDIPVRRLEGLQRVAPFQGVRRDQLTVSADRSRRIRAAEPVPESRSLPRVGDRASRMERPIDRRVDRQADRPIDRRVDRQADRPIDRRVDRQADRPIDRRIDPQAERPIGRRAERQPSRPAPRPDTPAARAPDRRDVVVNPPERVSPRPQGAPDRSTNPKKERPTKQSARKQKTEEPKKDDGH